MFPRFPWRTISVVGSSWAGICAIGAVLIKILDWAGRADIAGKLVPDFVGAAMLSWLWNPPSWLLLLVFLGSVTILALEWRNRAPASAPIQAGDIEPPSLVAIPATFGTEAANSIDNQISLTCSWVSSPAKQREDRPLVVIKILDPQTEDPTGGIGSSIARMEGQRSNDPIEWEYVTRGQTYKCSLENFSSIPVFGMEIEIEITWIGVVQDGNIYKSGERVSAETHKIPNMTLKPHPHGQDYFYVVNNSRFFVQVNVPLHGIASTPTAPSPHPVKLISSDGNSSFSFAPEPIN